MPTMSESSSSNSSSSDEQESKDQKNRLCPLPGAEEIGANRNNGNRDLQLLNHQDLEGSPIGRMHDAR